MPSSVTGVQTCALDRKSTRLNSSHSQISYAVFSLKKKIFINRSGPNVILSWLTNAAGLSGRDPQPQELGLRVRVPAQHRPRGVPLLCFFFNDTATTEIYTLSLHDALPISPEGCTPEKQGPEDHRSRGRAAAT